MPVTMPSSPDMLLLSTLHCECFVRGWSVEEFEDLLEADEVQAFVSDGYSGFGLLRVVEDEAEILTFAVTRKLQRQRIGTAILQAMLEHAKAKSVRSVFLEVQEDNQAARGLYGSLGFKEILRRKKYYSLPDHSQKDAIVMCREFD